MSEEKKNVLKEDEISEVVDVKMHELKLDDIPEATPGESSRPKISVKEYETSDDAPAETAETPEETSVETPVKEPEEKPVEDTDAKPAKDADVNAEETSEETSEESTGEKSEEKAEEKTAETTDAKPAKDADANAEETSEETSEESIGEKPEEKPAEDTDAKPAEASDAKPAEDSDTKSEESSEKSTDTKPEEKSEDKPAANQEEPEAPKKKSAGRIVAREVMLNKKTLYMTLFGVIGALAVMYFSLFYYYRNHFFPHTQINGLACDNKTADETEELIREKVNSYSLILQERNGKQERINGADVGVEVSFDGQIDKLLADQEAWKWPANIQSEKILLASQSVSYDEAALEEQIDALECTDEDMMTPSINAHLTEYTEDGYQIVDAIYGTILKRDVFEEQVKNAVASLKGRLNLAQSGCYEEPEYTADSEEIQELLAKASAYTDTTITFQIADQEEVIDGDEIAQWVRVDDEGNVTLDDEAAGDYLIKLEEKYNTTNSPKTLTTTYGSTVTVRPGTYGWRINHADTKALLIEHLENHEDYTGEFIFKQTANGYGEKDYGNTYVEVNIGAQHLWFYKNGALVLESDFVSGNVARGTITHPGAYYVAYKKKNAVLRGDDYETPVNYWMPFHNGEGFHDATWRGSFGGSIYKTSGSHGCVNMPLSKAKELYNSIEAGTPVLIY